MSGAARRASAASRAAISPSWRTGRRVKRMAAIARSRAQPWARLGQSKCRQSNRAISLSSGTFAALAPLPRAGATAASLAHLQEQAALAGHAEEAEKRRRAEDEVEGVEYQRLDEQVAAEDVIEHRS